MINFPFLDQWDHPCHIFPSTPHAKWPESWPESWPIFSAPLFQPNPTVPRSHGSTGPTSPTKSAPRCTEWSYILLRPRPRKSPREWSLDSTDELVDTPGRQIGQIPAMPWAVSPFGKLQWLSKITVLNRNIIYESMKLPCHSTICSMYGIFTNICLQIHPVL